MEFLENSPVPTVGLDTANSGYLIGIKTGLPSQLDRPNGCQPGGLGETELEGRIDYMSDFRPMATCIESPLFIPFSRQAAWKSAARAVPLEIRVSMVSNWYFFRFSVDDSVTLETIEATLLVN